AHLTSLAAELEALGVALVCLDQALDTSTPAGKLLFHVLGSIAEFERSLILERVKAGQAAAKRRGVRFGRPEVTDREARARIVRLREHGKTLAEVAELVGVSRRTVARVVAEKASEAA
ncbi:MAG: recombinase family protein, partial [Myxococcota bacterium]